MPYAWRTQKVSVVFGSRDLEIPPGKDHMSSHQNSRESWVPTHRSLKRCPIFLGGYVILPKGVVFNISRTRTFCFARFSQFCILRSRTMFPAPSFWGYIYNGLNLLIHNAQVYHQSLPALEEDSFGGRTGASKGKRHAGLHWSV